MTTVSIITVSYNSAETIRDTIESVRRQTYPHIEYIVVDGGSTDGTVDILKENEEAIDHWVSESDEGIYDAMNKGIRKSNGYIIGILNSDDWYEPDTVESVVRVFEDHDGVDIVHGAMKLWSEKGETDGYYGKKSDTSPLLTAPYNHPTCFVRRNVYKDIGLFDVTIPTAADYDFMLQCVQSRHRAKYIDRVLTNFRQGGATSKYQISPIYQIWRVLKKNNYALTAVTLSILFRITRDVLSLILNWTSNAKIRNYVRGYLPYRAQFSEGVREPGH